MFSAHLIFDPYLVILIFNSLNINWIVNLEFILWGKVKDEHF